MGINTSFLLRTQKYLFVFEFLLFVNLFTLVKAATFYWSGANGANWSDINNWSSTLSPSTPVTNLPTSADVVRINENAVTIPSGV